MVLKRTAEITRQKSHSDIVARGNSN